jgi:hypothetical protein
MLFSEMKHKSIGNIAYYAINLGTLSRYKNTYRNC